MRYAVQEIEVTEPLPDLRNLPKTSDIAGYALLIRRHGRAIGYVLGGLQPGDTMPGPKALAELLAREVGGKILTECIADELGLNKPAPTMPPVTIAICTRDRPQLLKRCLASLLPQLEAARQRGQVVDVLVIDNAPSDERTSEVVSSVEGVRYQREARPGLDFARNRALRASEAEFVAYLDDDVVVDRNWFAGLCEAWRENPDAGGFTGLVLAMELETRSQIIFERRGGFRRGFNKIRYGAEYPANMLYPCAAGIFGSGCNMVFRRSVMLELGGFDEALDTGPPLPGGGDLDAFYRVVRAGHVIAYEPQLLVFHQHRREMAALRRQYWSWGIGHMAFTAKCYRGDAPMRPTIRHLLFWWWTRHQLKETLRCLKRGDPVGLVVAELWGGLDGLIGGYERSQRHAQRIREAFPS
jgi:glycosyltransferase involved in cell wall biosynthesis